MEGSGTKGKETSSGEGLRFIGMLTQEWEIEWTRPPGSLNGDGMRCVEGVWSLMGAIGWPPMHGTVGASRKAKFGWRADAVSRYREAGSTITSAAGDTS